MGLGIVLIFYFIALSVAATISSVALVIAAYWYLRNVPGKRASLIALGVLPFACVVYAAVWFGGYALISDTVFHHDPMLGDGWYTDIPHGYAIDMIDVTDQGTVHPTVGPDRGLDNPQGISGVRRLQVAGDLILGSEDKGWFNDLGRESNTETGFFAIDTRTHAKEKFASEAELRAYAEQHGISLTLRPIADVYEQYRINWFDVTAGLILVLPPACLFVLLIWRLVRLKRNAHSEQSAMAQARDIQSIGLG